MTINERIKHAWNAFLSREPTEKKSDQYPYPLGGNSRNPSRTPSTYQTEKTITNGIYNQIATDVANCKIIHVTVDENDTFKDIRKSELNKRLNLFANKDQTARSFIKDVVMSMFDEGYVAIVPVDVDSGSDPRDSESYDILSWRTGKIKQWFPDDVLVEVYNDRKGIREDVKLPKQFVAIIENPFYAVMNEPNSTIKRLARKMALLDSADEKNNAGKLDMLIQLPFPVRGESRKKQAEERRRDIEQQLTGSKYGVAYIDTTEKVTQLNRPLENNLQSQIEYLQKQAYSQLGLTEEIFLGTANESTMLLYYDRTIEPILNAICDEIKRKFLSRTALSQGQSVMFFRNPFKLAPVTEIANAADTFIRNEILTANEFRGIVGFKPSDEDKANMLRNPNMPQEMDPSMMDPNMIDPQLQNGGQDPNQQLDDIDASLDELEDELNHSGILKHYASPYYDPVKAHEYYMRTRELKGRTSTARLNDEGKAAASYVKDQLNTERKNKVQAHKDYTTDRVSDETERAKSEIASYSEQAKGKIDNLRSRLKGMSKKQKERERPRIQAEIDRLREDNKQRRLSIQEDSKETKASYRDDHKTERTNLKEEYDQKYVDELDKIRSDSRYVKPTNTKKSKKKR